MRRQQRRDSDAEREQGVRRELFSRCWREDSGQDLVEYGLLAVLISTITVAALQSLGASVSAFWDRISSVLKK